MNKPLECLSFQLAIRNHDREFYTLTNGCKHADDPIDQFTSLYA